MSVRVHTTHANEAAMSLLDAPQINDLYDFDEDPLDDGLQALVIEDPGNLEAMVLIGTDDDIVAFANDILARVEARNR